MGDSKQSAIAKTDQEMKDHLAGMPNGAQDVLGSGWGAGDIMYADLNVTARSAEVTKHWLIMVI